MTLGDSHTEAEGLLAKQHWKTSPFKFDGYRVLANWAGSPAEKRGRRGRHAAGTVLDDEICMLD